MLVKTAAAAAQSARPPPRGAFIVLEGVDRCGKTTQSKLLLQRLVAAGLAAQAMRFPNRETATGRIINEYLTMPSSSPSSSSSSSSSDDASSEKRTTTTRPLDDCAIHLLFSANRWEASRDILETLANGTTIVCDRYAHSGVAFTSSKVVQEEGDTNQQQQQQQQQLSLEWCRAPDRGLPAPDAVIYLQLSADQAEERGGYVHLYSWCGTKRLFFSIDRCVFSRPCHSKRFYCICILTIARIIFLFLCCQLWRRALRKA
jgi:thymidylate kinase